MQFVMQHNLLQHFLAHDADTACVACCLPVLQPAVPFAGLFRLIDVPVSNCIHSGISNIYVLTQYNATSLNRHLSRAYQFVNGITFAGNDGVDVEGGGEGRGCASTHLPMYRRERLAVRHRKQHRLLHAGCF